MQARHVILVCLAGIAMCHSVCDAFADDRTAQLNSIKRRASTQIGAREFDAAVASLEALIKSAPKDDQALVMLGDAYRGLGNFSKAVANYENAIRVEYGNYQAHLKLGTLLMENGKTGRALTEFEIAMKFGDTDPLVHYNYALALNDLGRGREALTQWRIARDLSPDNAEFVAGVGVGLTGVDDTAAVAAFARAESLGVHGNAAFANNYALALERIGEHDKAESYFVEALAALRDRAASDSMSSAWAYENNAKKQVEYRRNLARHYLRAGKGEAAMREFQILVAVDDGKWSDTVYLARAMVDLSRFDDAIAQLATFADGVASGGIARTDPRIDRMPPSVGEALSIVGMAWRGKGDVARARGYLERAAREAPKDPSVLINYGVVLAESGMLPDAKAQWRRVLEIDPENATARANLSASGQ